MKKILVFTIILSVSFLMADTVSFDTPLGNFKMNVEQTTTSSSSDDETAYTSIVDEIANRLEIIEKKYLSKLNKLDQKKAARLTDDIYELLALFPEDVSFTITTSEGNADIQSDSNSASMNMDVSINITDDTQQNVEVKNKAINSSDFNQLLNNIENESFSDDQMSVLNIAVKRSYFTIRQLIQIVELFSFSDEKVEAIEKVYPRIVDMENAHNLINSLTYSSDKEAVEKILNSN